MNEWITAINDAIWSYVLIVALVGCGLWFTWRTRFVQFRMVGEMLRLLTESAVSTVEEQVKEKEGRSRHISSFQAFAVSVATRVGTGNLAGVATAIAIGGPGAVFWMWLIALVGSATAFVESTLAQLYKQKHKDSFIGGPAYYIQKGLKQRWMAVLFAGIVCHSHHVAVWLVEQLHSGEYYLRCHAGSLWLVARMGGRYSRSNGPVHRLWWHPAYCSGQFRDGAADGGGLYHFGIGDHRHEYPSDSPRF